MGTSCIPQRQHCWELLVPTPWLCARAGATRTHHSPAHILSPCSVSELWLQPRCPHTLELCVVFVCASWFSFGALRWVWPCNATPCVAGGVSSWGWRYLHVIQREIIKIKFKIRFHRVSCFPGKVFWNHILLLERKHYYFQPNHANIPLTHVCQNRASVGSFCIACVIFLRIKKLNQARNENQKCD